jgi:hypothetical protein
MLIVIAYVLFARKMIMLNTCLVGPMIKPTRESQSCGKSVCAQKRRCKTSTNWIA